MIASKFVRGVAVAVAAGAILGVVGCAPTSSAGAGATGGASSADTAIDSEPLRVATLIPTSLVPGNAQGNYALTVLDNVFRGLVRFDPETGEPVNEVAESIHSDDGLTWDVEIADGWTFHDGTPVTAHSFVDAWNASADPRNAWTGSGKFANIAGYDELNPDSGEPSVDGLSGLEVIDDAHFRVTLSAADAYFPYNFGTAAYYPLPEVAFADLDAYAKQPIGNGPYLVEDAWDGEQEIHLTRFDGFAGELAANSGITFVIYNDWATAYTDFKAGNLDLTSVPSADQLEAESLYADGFVRSTIGSGISYLSLPVNAPGWNNAEVRQALSLAIDRDALIAAFFDETTVPLTDFAVPASIGYRDSDETGTLTYDIEKAKELWAASGGIEGPISIGLPQGTGREDWSEAILKQWQDAFGIEIGTVEPLANSSTAIRNGEFLFPVSLGRVSDTPSPTTILSQHFLPGGNYNHAGWADDTYNALYEAALSSEDPAETAFNDAKDYLAEQLPIIPLWSGASAWVHSDRVSDFPVDVYNKSNYAFISVSS